MSPVIIFSWKKFENAESLSFFEWNIFFLRDLWNRSSGSVHPNRYFCFFSFWISVFHWFFHDFGMYDLILFRKSILPVELIDDRENISLFMYIFGNSESYPWRSSESEFTRYSSMDISSDWSNEMCEFLVISLPMNHDIRVALVTWNCHF